MLSIAAMLFAVACGTGELPTGTETVPPTDAPTQLATPPLATPTPQSTILPDERDTHAVIRQLGGADPGVAKVVEIIEREDVEALLEHLMASENACEAEFYRGTNGCELYGVPTGTVLEFVYLGEFSGGVLRSMAQQQFASDLSGNSPTLELVAVREGTSLVLIFDLDSEDPGQFVIEFDRSSDVVTRATSRPNVMPLDFVRVAEHSGADVYDVLAAADSFHEKEAAFIADSLANQTALPYDYPWWRPAGFPNP